MEYKADFLHPDRIINKQNKYPVLLLTQGEDSGYEEYIDPRTWSISNGVLFVEMSGLLGLSVRAEAVLRNPHHLEKVREHNQVIFVWTDQLNDRETVQQLKKLGVTSRGFVEFSWKMTYHLRKSRYQYKTG